MKLALFLIASFFNIVAIRKLYPLTVMQRYQPIFILSLILLVEYSAIFWLDLSKVLILNEFLIASIVQVSATIILFALIRLFLRFGNFTHYQVVVYLLLLFLAVLIDAVFLLNSLRSFFMISTNILLFLISVIVLIFWGALYLEYKKLSFAVTFLAFVTVALIKIFFSTETFITPLLMYLFSVTVYIYVEYVHPYPTLFDKYVFNKPLHLFWGSLVFFTGLLLLLT